MNAHTNAKPRTVSHTKTLTMTKTYKSEIGFTLVTPVAFLLLSVEAFMIINKLWAGAALVGLVIILIGYLFVDTSYKLTHDKKLKVKSGFLINKEIDVFTIEKVEPTRSPAASPALSLDRLKVIYDKHDYVIISPKEKVEFIRDLKNINPNIIVA